MSCRGISTIGGLGVAALVALVVAALVAPAVASAAGEGAISGEVTLAAGGAPAVEAEVCAEGEEGPEEFTLACVLTEADGSYEIDGLAPAGYVVSFEAGESGHYLVRQFWHGVGRYEEATRVQVTAGATASGIDAAMAEGGAIAGRVTAAVGGAPLAEVEVCSWSEPGGSFDRCTETAGDGTYELVGIAPGLHEVEFFPYTGAYEPQFRHGVSVAVGVRTESVNAALAAEPSSNGQIRGHVYAAATHAALKGVPVCAIDESGRSRGCARTGPAGGYGFAAVPTGRWRIAFSPDPGEFEQFEPGEITADAWPTQFWNGKPTLAQADAIVVAPGGVVEGIDGLLGPGPRSSASAPKAATPASSPAPVRPKPKPLTCRKGFAKKRVKGKTRCLRRHKRHRHHKHRGHR